jgi:hypothetical protein
VIHISVQARKICRFAGSALCLALLLSGRIYAADPPPLTPADNAPAVNPGVNAQQLCAAPASELQEQVSSMTARREVTTEHQQAFLGLVDSCRKVYLSEIERLAADFAQLPSDSVCHAAQRDLPEGLVVFDDIEAHARALHFDSQENREAAGTFFSLTGPGMVRAVNGLYLLRYGVCVEEQSAPFDTPLTDSVISPSPILTQ